MLPLLQHCMFAYQQIQYDGIQYDSIMHCVDPTSISNMKKFVIRKNIWSKPSTKPSVRSLGLSFVKSKNLNCKSADQHKRNSFKRSRVNNLVPLQTKYHSRRLHITSTTMNRDITQRFLKESKACPKILQLRNFGLKLNFCRFSL